MKYKIRFACHIATLVTGLLLISGCTWQIPEGITVTGTPNYQLPAGSTTLDVGQMLQLDSMLGSFDGSESITINQADVISDFGLPTVIFNNVPEPGPAAEQVSFDDGGTADPQEFEAILVPPGIDPIDKFTEVEFESGTLNIELTFAGLSGGVSVEVSAMRIVDPADSYNVLATANEATQTYTQATPTRTYSFDMTDVVLPNRFAMEMVMDFTGGAGTLNSLTLTMVPTLVAPLVRRAEGVEINPPVAAIDQQSDPFSFELPDIVDSAEVSDGEIVVAVSTPSGWSGVDITVDACIVDDVGAQLVPPVCDSDTGLNPELHLDLAGVTVDGSDMKVEYDYSVASPSATVTMSAGQAEIDMDVSVVLNEVDLILLTRKQYTDPSGDPFFSFSADVFGRSQPDDEMIGQVLDNLESADLHYTIDNSTNLAIELVVVDGTWFDKTIYFDEPTGTMELDEDVIADFKTRLFTPEMQIWLPAGTLPFDPSGDITIDLWIELQTDIEYSFPLGGE